MPLDTKNSKVINVLTNEGNALDCRSIILGQEFHFEISIDEEGKLDLSVDGEKNFRDILENISFKCSTPVDTILPLLLVNLALLNNMPAKPTTKTPLVKDVFVDSLTVH